MNESTTFLITGACGMLGRAMTGLLGTQTTALTFADLDITNYAAVAAALNRYRPTTLINCAAATDVDRCETDHAYADAGNTTGPRTLAEACAAHKVAMVHVSTDFVFDGATEVPYTEKDEPRPVNYYGLSKLRGEEAVRELMPQALVVRTSWTYGPVGLAGTNFPLKVLEWACRPGPLRVATDQFGSPTYAPHLATGILELLEMNATGMFHLAGGGCTSRWEIAHETLATVQTVTADPAAFRLADIDFTVPILPAAAIDFPAPAPRPAFSCLDCGKAARLGVTLPPWRIGLALYITGLLRKHDSAVDIWDRHLPAGCAPTQSKFAAGSGETKGTTA